MAMKAGVPGSPRRKIFRDAGYRCVFCGLVGWEVIRGGGTFVHPTGIKDVFLSIDHIIPRSKGGAAKDPSNLQVLCTTCNTRKGTRVIIYADQNAQA